MFKDVTVIISNIFLNIFQVSVTTSSSDDEDWLSVHKTPELYPLLVEPIRAQPAPTTSAPPPPPHPHEDAINNIVAMGFSDREAVRFFYCKYSTYFFLEILRCAVYRFRF